MIHSTAIIEKGAEIDTGVEIGPWCTVGARVKIKKGTRLMSHVVVDGDTEIGENNIFFPFSVIGGVPQDLKYKGEPTKLRIGNNNTIRESATLNLGTAQAGGITSLGHNNLLMAYTHFGHDTHVGNHCIIANGGTLAGHVIIEDYVTLGGLTAVSQFIRVGAHAYIGGQSGVEKDVPPFSICVGSRPCAMKGTNIVGLRRRGYTADRIQIINESIKLWMRPDIQKEQCLLEIQSQYGEIAEVQQFLGFIRASESGVVR